MASSKAYEGAPKAIFGCIDEEVCVEVLYHSVCNVWALIEVLRAALTCSEQSSAHVEKTRSCKKYVTCCHVGTSFNKRLHASGKCSFSMLNWTRVVSVVRVY